jgi:DNA-binding GntR family transcriptional regulator
MPVRLSEKAYQLIKEKIVTRDLAPLSVIDEQSLRIDLGLVGLSDRNQGSPVTPG